MKIQNKQLTNSVNTQLDTDELHTTEDIVRYLSSIKIPNNSKPSDFLKPFFEKLEEGDEGLYESFKKYLEIYNLKTDDMASAWLLLREQVLGEIPNIKNQEDLQEYLIKGNIKHALSLTDRESFVNDLEKYNPELYPLFTKWLGESESWYGLKNFVSNFESATQEFEEAREPEQLEITINKYQENLPLFTNPKFYLPHLSEEFFTKNGLTPTAFLKTFRIPLTEDLLTRSPVFHKLLMEELAPTFKFMELAGSFDFYLFNKKDPPELYPKVYLFDDKYPPNVNNYLGILLHNIIYNTSDVVCYKTKDLDKSKQTIKGNITSESKDLYELKQAIKLNRELNRKLNLFNEVNKKQSTENVKLETIEDLIEKLESKIPPLTKITEFFLGLFQGCCGRQP